MDSGFVLIAEQTVSISVPFFLAALGGVICERAGVVNIALEGIMLNGAFCQVLVTYWTGNPWLGLLAATAGGVLTVLPHAVASIKFRVNQIVSGLAINLGAVGITKFFLKIVFDSSSNSERIVGISALNIPILSKIPIIREIVSNPLILIAIGLFVVIQIFLFKTKWGLRLRAAGESAEASVSVGINVVKIRYFACLASGVLAGLAGAWLALSQHQFTDGMSGGRGYIALAAVIFGRWKPNGVLIASLIFGFAEALQIGLQSAGIEIPTQFVQMIPYLVTIIVLAGFVGRARPPADDGKPYEPA
ncbi:MAG: ABC transporter permease [Elusimicrobia bacterium]|nr:ABC transporter permease [Elusimicrobiota bacterium]